MNHLAHVLLAGPRPEARLGAMLGDFWRGAPDPSWSPGVGAGVRMHRKIDVYTDSHPVVVEARRLFEPPLRRYAGILLDVYFDHALARFWPRFSAESLQSLSDDLLALLATARAWLPADLTRFAGYMRNNGLFASYAQRETIERVLAGIGMRLRHANPVDGAGAALWERGAALDACFANFFPDLVVEARRLRAELGLE